MNRPNSDGISRKGLDTAFEVDETRKSQLLLEAQLLRDRGEDENAAAKFAECAEIEERLSEACEQAGLTEKYFVQASAERQGATAWRGIALQQDAEATRAELTMCAELEEANAACLERLLGLEEGTTKLA